MEGRRIYYFVSSRLEARIGGVWGLVAAPLTSSPYPTTSVLVGYLILFLQWSYKQEYVVNKIIREVTAGGRC